MKGFTLIEIVVVIAIIGIFTGVSLTGYTTSIREKALEKDVELVTSRLELAREYTMSRNVQGLTGCDLDGYRINVPSAAADYHLVRICGGTTTTVQSYALENTVFDSAVNVTFNYPLGSVTGTQTIVINHEGMGRCVGISVSSAGPITANDPYAC